MKCLSTLNSNIDELIPVFEYNILINLKAQELILLTDISFSLYGPFIPTDRVNKINANVPVI